MRLRALDEHQLAEHLAHTHVRRGGRGLDRDDYRVHHGRLPLAPLGRLRVQRVVGHDARGDHLAPLALHARVDDDALRDVAARLQAGVAVALEPAAAREEARAEVALRHLARLRHRQPDRGARRALDAARLAVALQPALAPAALVAQVAREEGAATAGLVTLLEPVARALEMVEPAVVPVALEAAPGAKRARAIVALELACALQRV